jgi:hypothetical protein
LFDLRRDMSRRGADLSALTSKQFFPQLISGPFHHGLVIVFTMAIVMSLIGAAASLFRGGRYIHAEQPSEQRARASSPLSAPARASR